MTSRDSGSSCIVRLLMIIGMGSMAGGMALFYSLGMFALAVFAPFLVLGMILVLLAGCIAIMEQKNVPHSKPMQPLYRDRPPEYFVNDLMALNQIAEAARAKGILVERPSTDNPTEVYRSLRCPICRYLFDIGRTRIVGNAVICPSCEQDMKL